VCLVSCVYCACACVCVSVCMLCLCSWLNLHGHSDVFGSIILLLALSFHPSHLYLSQPHPHCHPPSTSFPPPPPTPHLPHIILSHVTPANSPILYVNHFFLYCFSLGCHSLCMNSDNFLSSHPSIHPSCSASFLPFLPFSSH